MKRSGSPHIIMNDLSRYDRAEEHGDIEIPRSMVNSELLDIQHITNSCLLHTLDIRAVVKSERSQSVQKWIIVKSHLLIPKLMLCTQSKENFAQIGDLLPIPKNMIFQQLEGVYKV